MALRSVAMMSAPVRMPQRKRQSVTTACRRVLTSDAVCHALAVATTELRAGSLAGGRYKGTR